MFVYTVLMLGKVNYVSFHTEMPLFIQEFKPTRDLTLVLSYYTL